MDRRKQAENEHDKILATVPRSTVESQVVLLSGYSTGIVIALTLGQPDDDHGAIRGEKPTSDEETQNRNNVLSSVTASVKDVLAQTGGNAMLPCRFTGPGIPIGQRNANDADGAATWYIYLDRLQALKTPPDLAEARVGWLTGHDWPDDMQRRNTVGDTNFLLQ
ncbi:hypothetical protein WH47_12811 [Habropoda laboriosa]|uniref:Uncharacterized protein n=1 Tax=Habropoda laboriosa TaxID=597456 RepID=A0A0L7R553_9HYME|nr:hypothetical protein WH47_12811 [Habropoda laboriosa]